MVVLRWTQVFPTGFPSLFNATVVPYNLVTILLIRDQ